MWIEQLITSFVASGAFGILFNAPKKSLLKCGFVGMVGWMVYIVFVEINLDVILATFIASFFIASISQFFAKIYKTPSIIFSVAGIIPLVPGGLAYDAMRNIVTNDYNVAIQLGVKVFLISGAIAIGLVFSEVANQLVMKAQAQGNK
ncbi:threonine/serine exporter family protein [Bacillus sp. DJP31]|uniref:threonine/serine exporter family protein n=1 Tax=Bacillus sp. DJP31 TaxID=3409789 RepID=UPI003BB7F5E0